METFHIILEVFGALFIITMIIAFSTMNSDSNKKLAEDHKNKIIEEYKQSEEFQQFFQKPKTLEEKYPEQDFSEVQFFSENEITQEKIKNLKDRKIDSKYLRPKKDAEDVNMFFKKKVVITGEFTRFPDRNELAEILYESGADLDTNITEKTHYLITGIDAGWRKLELAEEYGITIFSEEEIIKILGLE